MSIHLFPKKTGDDLDAIRRKKPLVHNITNYVVMNWTANILLACGASPVMAHAAEEVEDMVSLAGALVLNIGTLTPAWIDSMIKAGKKANELNKPVVLDPVGSGATRLRTDSAKRILDEVKVSVVRGNASEVLSLAGEGSGARGVDSTHGVDEAVNAAIVLAKELKTTIAITGKVDLITDGQQTFRVANGHPLMGYVTGMGCAVTALIGAFLAVEADPAMAATSALALAGVAGERAAKEAVGPGSFQTALLDQLYLLDAKTLEEKSTITLQE